MCSLLWICLLWITAIEGRDLDSDISQLQIREQSLEVENKLR